MKRWCLCFVSLLLCLLLGACGGDASSAGQVPTNTTSAGSPQQAPPSSTSPDTLQVTRTDLSPADNLGPFESTITDVPAVQKLYQAALSLPARSTGQELNEACLSEMGVVYHLIFAQGDKEVQRMNLDPGECRLLSLSSTDLRQVDSAFLKLFQNTLHLDSLT